MIDWLYKNKRNENKFIEVRRYNDGHYVWKQSIRHKAKLEKKSNIEIDILNYTGCSLKRCKKGVWKRQRKGVIDEVLNDYNIVKSKIEA